MTDESEKQKEQEDFKVSDRRFSVRGYEDEEEEESSGAPAAQDTPVAQDAPVTPGFSPEPPPAPEPPAVSPEGAGDAAPAPEAGTEEEEADPSGREFEMLMAILQGNALAAMGLNPQTGERVGSVDPRTARLFVDMAQMVKAKMEPNLSPEEEGLISHLISDLQMLYVREVGIGG